MAMSYTRGYGTNAVIKSLYARRDTLNNAMEEVGRQAAEDIKNRSVAYAPIDEGHLEEAHRVVVRSTRSGNFAFDVEVDPSVADVGDYLDFIHNHQYNLGPLSEAKADASGEPVGNKFLERAFDREKPEVLAKYRAITRQFTRGI